MSSPAITIKAIQLAVARRYGVSLSELKSPRRFAHLAHARMIAVYIAYKLTGRSLPVIGRAFDRDHTSILHANNTMKLKLLSDLALAAEIDSIIAEVRATAVSGTFGLGLAQAAELDAALNAHGLELAIVPIGTRDANGFAKRTGGSK